MNITFEAPDKINGLMTITLEKEDYQKEVEKTAEYSIFSYYLAPNYDFIHDVLYYGDDVEVLDPEILRSAISKITAKMNEQYDGK